MNKLPLLHPNSEDLLLYIDGELPEPGQAAIRKHLAGCWKCRREVEELEGAVSEYMRYQTAVDAAEGTAGTRSSTDLRRKMERLEAQLGRPGLWSRARTRLTFPAPAYAWRLAAGIAVMATAWAAVTLVQRMVLAPKPQEPARQVAPAIQPASPARATAPTLPPLPSSLPRQAAAMAEPPSPALADSPEIAALVKLHELGADLGEPVETVASPGGAVTVICRQVGREREAEIRSALAGIPGVTVQSEAASRPDTRPDAGKRPRTVVSLGNGGNPLERALAEQLGGKAAFDRLANEILEQEDGLMARAYALHDIEERFPASRQTELGPRDGAALAAVIADHRRVALEKGWEVESRVAAISRALGFADPTARQPAASGLFPAAHRMDRILNVIFGGSPSDLTGPELSVELNAARAQLRAALEAQR
jgi:anti-sigma factor RsiW